ncbi:MAG TPA: DNA repair protein RecO [Candidatus Acidoferrales bacterium]|nr:DNA repair protein RecO [Candidatus Acidoferrales bacterium]
MPLREAEAMVLRTYPLGEADRLVSFLGRSVGRLRGVARGARRPRSRFGSTLELLSHVRVWFYERETRELVRINQCELIESFLDAHRDYASGVALALVSEVTEAVLPEREPAEAAFRLVLLTARAIEQRGGIALPLAYFNLWMVKLGGWLPQLHSCGRCGREVGSEAVFGSPMQAGLACAACRRPGMRPVSATALALARRILMEKLDRLAEEDWPAVPLDELNAYLLDLLEHQIERKLTTRRLIEGKLEPST